DPSTPAPPVHIRATGLVGGGAAPPCPPVPPQADAAAPARCVRRLHPAHPTLVRHALSDTAAIERTVVTAFVRTPDRTEPLLRPRPHPAAAEQVSQRQAVAAQS